MGVTEKELAGRWPGRGSVPSWRRGVDREGSVENVCTSLGFSRCCLPPELIAEHWHEVRSLKWWLANVREPQSGSDAYSRCIRTSAGEAGTPAVCVVSPIVSSFENHHLGLVRAECSTDVDVAS